MQDFGLSIEARGGHRAGMNGSAAQMREIDAAGLHPRLTRGVHCVRAVDAVSGHGRAPRRIVRRGRLARRAARARHVEAGRGDPCSVLRVAMLLQIARYFLERVLKLGAEIVQRRDDRDRDQGSDQRIFDRRSAGLVGEKCPDAIEYHRFPCLYLA